MSSRLQRKIGPWPLWVWIVIGAALGGGAYLWNRKQAAATGVAGGDVTDLGGTGTGAFGPVDPNTGIPYSFESTPGATSGATTAAQEVADITDFVTALEDAGLIPRQPEGDPKDLTPAQRAKYQKLIKKQREALKKKRHGGRDHSGGSKKGTRGQHKPKKHPATSTGAGASAGGNGHKAAPHPSKRKKK